ncbi:MAG TPA: hypothetical protein PLP95_06065, partial [Microthrixaceae bacterium]|nr:hypothetical protein [Microthrixaceae bacterium]
MPDANLGEPRTPHLPAPRRQRLRHATLQGQRAWTSGRAAGGSTGIVQSSLHLPQYGAEPVDHSEQEPLR